MTSCMSSKRATNCANSPYGEDGTRTHNLPRARRTLTQLSYFPVARNRACSARSPVVEPMGLEPMTFSVPRCCAPNCAKAPTGRGTIAASVDRRCSDPIAGVLCRRGGAHHIPSDAGCPVPPLRAIARYRRSHQAAPARATHSGSHHFGHVAVLTGLRPPETHGPHRMRRRSAPNFLTLYRKRAAGRA